MARCSLFLDRKSPQIEPLVLKNIFIIKFMMSLERVSSVESIMLNGVNYSINEDFMDINKHKQTIENSRKCSSFYDNLCLEF